MESLTLPFYNTAETVGARKEGAEGGRESGAALGLITAVNPLPSTKMAPARGPGGQ